MFSFPLLDLLFQMLNGLERENLCIVKDLSVKLNQILSLFTLKIQTDLIQECIRSLQQMSMAQTLVISMLQWLIGQVHQLGLLFTKMLRKTKSRSAGRNLGMMVDVKSLDI